MSASNPPVVGPSNGASPLGPPPLVATPVVPPPAMVGPTPPAGDRLPRPPRRRGAGLAALAVLLVVGGAAAAGLLALRLDDRVDVLIARRAIPPGAQISADDLAVAPVASQGLRLIPAGRQDSVIGQYAALPIAAGRLLDADMFTGQGFLTKGKAAVGLTVKPGQMPASGLKIGDRVELVKITDSGGESVTEALVSSFQAPDTGAFGGGGSDSVATLIVARDKVETVAAVTQSGRFAIVLLERGGVVATG